MMKTVFEKYFEILMIPMRQIVPKSIKNISPVFPRICKKKPAANSNAENRSKDGHDAR